MTETVISNLEYNPQSKFLLVGEPLQQLPHKCCACSRYGSNIPEEPLEFIDFNLDIEFYGKIFICVDCVREMANQLGFMDPSQVKQLVAKKSELIGDVSNLLNENKELRDALAGFRTVFGSSDTTVSDSFASVEGEDTLTEEPDGASTEPAEVEPEPIEQNDEPGLTDLSVDDTLDSLIDDI